MTDSINKFLNINNFQRAWEKVSENRGSAGIDNQTIAEFAQNPILNLTILLDKVANNTYQPHPYKQILIPKTKGKWRELKIPTVQDRVVQQALLNVISPILEPQFSPSSFAYRPNISYINAVEQVAYLRDLGYQWLLDADIVQYFDHIDHSRLLREVRKSLDNPRILCLIKSWLTVGVYTESGTLTYPEKGIPQGSVISPLLANVYLNEFDHLIANSDLKLIRYADDFLVFATTQTRIIQAYSQIGQFLQSIGLNFHAEKTQITNFQRGFRFLGHGFLDQAIFPLESSKKRVKTAEKSQKSTSKKKGIITTTESINYHNFWNTAMATLYLMEQGTTLYKEHQRLIVQISEKTKLEIPLRDVERILVFGNIQLTTQVINACLQENILILFVSPQGQYRGHLWSLESIHLHNELVQLERWKFLPFQLYVSKAIVEGKLINSKQLLMRLNRKRKLPEIEKAILGINSDIKALDSVDNIDSLRGYEGISAARYFPAFGQLITNSNFPFCQRYRQPPTDSVNSLLSFGYTLLFNNVLSLIIAEGLSPYLGNFHYGEDKKPYLAFDLMEEFRSPIVDSLVLKTLNSNIFKPDDFECVNSEGAIYLKASARRIFCEQFEKRMNEEISHPDLQSPVSYRYAIQLQIRRYKRCLLSSVPYESFVRAL